MRKLGVVSGEMNFELDLQNLILKETNEVYNVQVLQYTDPASAAAPKDLS